MPTLWDEYGIDFTGSKIDKYFFRSPLGKGGSANVYLADEVVTAGVTRRVAIKVFLAEIEDRISFNQMFETFKRDLQFLTELCENSPIIQYFNTLTPDITVLPDGGIVTISAIPESVSQQKCPTLTAFMIVMEYADGGSLDGSYRDEVMIQNGDNIHLSHFKDICAALDAAHEKHIIHRDVKPANLFYFRKINKVKLGDFGIAMFSDDISQTSYLVGSLPYLAPEVFKSKHHTLKSDIYALGCTFYELYTGKRPFTLSQEVLHNCGNNILQLLKEYYQCHKNIDRPDAITSIGPNPSIHLNYIIKKMMAIDPEKRPDLQEVIVALTEEQSGQTVVVDNILEIAERTELSKVQTYQSDYRINPQFRRTHMKEAVFFLFIDVQPRLEIKLKRMFALLDGFFRDTYSIHEVYGRNDFIVEVWSRSDRRTIKTFVEKLKNYVLDGNNESVSVMACDDIRYIGKTIKKFTLDYGKKTDMLIKINEAQVHNNKEAAKDLIKEGIYIGKSVKDIGKQRIKCFCLVKSVSDSDESDRQMQSILLKDSITNADIDALKFDIVLYQKTYKPIERIANEASDHMIRYVSPSYEKVIEIPELILDKIPRYRFKTITMLSTKRYIIESDNLFISRKM